MSMCLLWLGLLHISLSALWQAANIQAAVTIDQVTLTVLPANNVESGTNVILRCEASVSQSLPQPLTYSFSLLQDSQVMYSKNSSASVVERSLSPARVSNSGRYQCSVHIYNKQKMSNILSLRVTADRAIFNITSISFPEEIYSFRCQASNHVPSFSKTSEPLRAPVIVPVSRPDLEPKEVTVTEGSDLILICSVHQGTYPITFTWYYNRVKLPSSTQEVRSLEGSYVVKAIEQNQRGDYYCEASNYAIETKKSYPARIGVSLALWKKALIGVFCILLLVAIVIVLTVLLKKLSNPRRKKQATELSVKPSRPKSGDPMRISLTLDIEDNTALNGTPCVMGRNVWSENVSGSDSDNHTDEDSELVHPQEVDPRGDVPVKKTTEPEYSVQHTEVQVSTPGVSEQAEGQAALEYAQLNNSEQEPA
ncbi:platelet endothelial cell adhesion molecule-like [Sinocyclocheilus rhinocerous]|uniref:platelet endothelial cell adhesion molecule-like n=1 Tax=Sinocyclocheilus rhinocerous TaxID=307959 RepID=UPI0007B9C9DE|nr:PREDICTED: platelet endothelial cell adhesion molecule-like [Sinocyclocheilus rhinocerous]